MATIPRNLLVFLQMLDEYLVDEGRVQLLIGGASALVLAYDGQLATRDLDVIGERTGVLLALSERMGSGSEAHRLTGYYLDVVPPGWFPNAPGWRARAVPVPVPGLQHIELKVLEVHDLILSKLKRFGSGDRDDIRSLCDRAEFDVEILKERYQQARQLYDRDEEEKLDENFRFVEIEFLGEEPSHFD